MRTIEIRITEDVILNNTGYTVEQLAEANGYQKIIPNKDYIEATGETEAIGTRTIENTQTCVEYLARQGLETIVRSLASPLLQRVTYQAQNEAQQAFNQALKAVIENSEIKVTN